MLDRARERVSRATAGRITTIQADIREAKLPDGEFDIVLAAAVLHHLRADEEWREVYAGQAPRDIGRPQQAFLDVADRVTDSVLDAGCGTGDNALFFASRGHKVTGIDFLEEPIQRAKRKAAERGLMATFLVMDTLALKDLPEVFDSVTDSGLFHVFSDEDRQRYVEGLVSVLKPGGRLFLLCFSDEEPGTQRPRRVSKKELHDAFARAGPSSPSSRPGPRSGPTSRI
jgi:ubiquinone/menaquinone biosynthesis C-methylase UbiE